LRQQVGFSLKLREIQLRRPDTSWTAVVRGGVIFGIEKLNSEKSLATMIPCPRSYGITVSKPFTATDHGQNELVMDPVTRRPMAKDQLMWFIKKGDVILSNEPRIVEQSFAKIFSENDLRRGEIPIYAYDDDDIPDRFAHSWNELKRIHMVDWDLTDIPLQEFTLQRSSRRRPPFYVTSLKLIVTLDPRLLKLELFWKDRILSSKDIDVQMNSDS